VCGSGTPSHRPGRRAARRRPRSNSRRRSRSATGASCRRWAAAFPPVGGGTWSTLLSARDVDHTIGPEARPAPTRAYAAEMAQARSIQVRRSRSTFRTECSVATDIQAPAERIWSLLTDAPGMTAWNSTLTSIGGPIELGGTVKMEGPEPPGRTFAPQGTRVERNPGVA